MRHILKYKLLPIVHHDCHVNPLVYTNEKVKYCHIFDYFQDIKPKVGKRIIFGVQLPCTLFCHMVSKSFTIIKIL